MSALPAYGFRGLVVCPFVFGHAMRAQPPPRPRRYRADLTIQPGPSPALIPGGYANRDRQRRRLAGTTEHCQNLLLSRGDNFPRQSPWFTMATRSAFCREQGSNDRNDTK